MTLAHASAAEQQAFWEPEILHPGKSRLEMGNLCLYQPQHIAAQTPVLQRPL